MILTPGSSPTVLQPQSDEVHEQRATADGAYLQNISVLLIQAVPYLMPVAFLNCPFKGIIQE